ncbi:putative death-receptor fusion protein-domain-containing protein [Annulohypoxylon truncatum]|uniref:putative death-receptor fusion protein-domain-containing protein n=1 Tax=Annulohypoxylon truncatum TaxID=327061 RepID=UPI002007CE15|nr:putative death-receptor fusion protein-domain-containing protein [Annulohypoxylon truncatum]KAI1212980.1 putative death-receptor fusion protein-domain-containing protein [Annulohypoxylon truncatum]
MEASILAGVGKTDFNPKHAVSWLEGQPEELRLWQAVFEELILCASRPKQSSGNTCGKLYGFVEQCSRSSKPVLRNFAFAESTALRLFDFFMEWNEQDSHRSMRLVLDFLVFFISNNPAPEVGVSVRDTILNNTISTITQQSSRPSVKSAIAALDHFIQKKLVYLYSVLEIYREINNLPSNETRLWDSFVAKIFTWMELHHICSIAGKLLVTIFTNSWFEDRDVRHSPESWHEFIYKALQMNTDYLEPIKLYIFVPLFKADRNGSLIYLQRLYSLQTLNCHDSNGLDHNSMLWLAMLEAGKKVGVVDDPGREPEKNSQSTSQLRAEILESVLCHNSFEARSSAVSILIASSSTTKPYTAEALELLKKHLPSFHEDSDPKMRYDVLGHSRNMVKRIQSTVESLQRETERISKKMNKTGATKITPKVSPESKDSQLQKHQEVTIVELRATLRRHEDFISWYVGFLKDELAPTTSYQRHITALKAMVYIIQSLTPHGNNADISYELRSLLVDTIWFRSVLDLIMDPFDDVRETAALLVMSLSLESTDSSLGGQIVRLGSTPIEELRSFCRKADELARMTARADHSDGAARSFELLCRWSTNTDQKLAIPFQVLWRLEGKLSTAKKDLATAVLQAPIHGNFASLRYIWASLSHVKFSETDLKVLAGLQDRVISCCRKIWRIVRHVLCDDSPEGHLPEELEEVEGLDTKDLLSYSFRAIHESSNLMRTIANNARQSRGHGLLAPSRQNFEAIGRLTFDELSNLRHRGAFTTVSQTFTSCCQLVKYFPVESDDVPSLLDEWYTGALSCIHTQASTTRRSAGIPALIVGILSSDAERPTFEDVIRNLQDIGGQPALVSETDGSNLPQVHALNCIKDVFKSSFLSKRAEPYLTDCLQLAANSLKSEVWAIRNCGLLLLRSLIDCLFGTSESKSSIEAGWDGRTIKISYHKFKALPQLLVSLLEMGQQSTGVLMGSQTAESVFPALDIIRRAGPPEEVRDKLYSIIAWYLGSRIWHVREIASRTLCSFLLKPGWTESIGNLLENCGSSANKLHGVLLTLKFLLERLAEVMPDQLSGHEIRTVQNLLGGLLTDGRINACSEVRVVYVEVISFITRLNLSGVDVSIESFDNLMPKVFALSDRPDTGITPSALLDIGLGEAAIQHALRRPSTEGRRVIAHILKASLKGDMNVTCSILESISTLGPSLSNETRPGLVDAYIQVCLETDAPEPRTIALENLADLLDGIMRDTSSEGSNHLPPNKTTKQLWADLLGKPMNPSLSDAIIRISGPLLAIALSQEEREAWDSLEPWVRSWGVMMGDAGMADRTFDTRIAAAQAMHSFSTSLNFDAPDNPLDVAHLPWLLALYDSLNDDDDEVRAAAALAAAPLLSNQRLVSVEAGRRLLRRLLAWYGAADEFKAYVACRMTGHNVPPSTSSSSSGNVPTSSLLLSSWTPASAQLAEAMRFDDSLFVIEEQNLYVDEVREARRWSDLFSSLPSPPTPPSSSSPSSFPSPSSSSSSSPSAAETALSQWILAGLQTLTRLARSEPRDGPLGWTSKPEVFAICARVLVGGAALAKAGRNAEVGAALRGFRDEGRRADVHGLLLGMGDGFE